MSGWVAGAVVGGAYLTSKAVSNAANTQSTAATQAAAMQTDAANRAADLQYQQFRENVALQEPWRQAGLNALPKLTEQANAMPPAFKFTAQDFETNQDPGYSFRFTEGLKALDRSAASRGGLISGGALKAATRFGQDLSSQEYNNAYNRALTGYNTGVARESTGYNRLAALANIGQTTTQQIAGQGSTTASNVGNLLQNAAGATAGGITGAANARASGYIGGANALTSGLGTYLSYNSSNSLLNALRGGGASGDAAAAINPYFSTGFTPT
jgi:hypothetical protein